MKPTPRKENSHNANLLENAPVSLSISSLILNQTVTKILDAAWEKDTLKKYLKNYNIQETKQLMTKNIDQTRERLNYTFEDVNLEPMRVDRDLDSRELKVRYKPRPSPPKPLILTDSNTFARRSIMKNGTSPKSRVSVSGGSALIRSVKLGM